jgi:ABC-2 type transport system permease protein
MSPALVSEYASALGATFKRDLYIFLSYRTRAVTQVVSMLLALSLFYYVSKIVRPDAVGPHGRYYAFVVVGIVGMSVLTSAINISDIVRMELMSGNFERILISPLGPVAGVISLALFPILYASAFAGVMLVLASVIFGVQVHLAGVPPALLVGALGALAFASIGLLFVAGLLVYKSSLGSTWIVAGLGLLAGVYFPVKLLPQFTHWVAQVQPLTPAVDLLRHLLVGTRGLQPVWVELLKLVGFTVVLMPLSGAMLWLAVDISRRRGTILEF